MADMFGAPIGVRAFQHDAQTSLLNEIKAHEEMAQLAMMPQKKALLGAQVREHTAKAEGLEISLANERKWAQALAARSVGAGNKTSPVGADGKPKSPQNQFFDLADLAMGVGQVDKAMKFADAGGKLLVRDARAQAAEATQRVNELKARDKNLNLLVGSLRNSTDQASWDRNNAVYASLTGQPSPYSMVPFSSNLVKTLEQTVLSAKDAIKLDLDKLNVDSQIRTRNARTGIAQQRLGISQTLANLAERREQRLEKVGGKPVGSPTNADLTSVGALIEEMYPNFTSDGKERNRATREIASRAKEIQRSNPGLGIQVAQRRALAELKDDFVTDSVTVLGIDMPGTRKTKFTGGGKSAATAMQIPVTTLGAPDAEKMIAGRFYDTPRGVVKYLGGGKVEPVATDGTGTGAGGGRSAVPGLDDEDLDDDEDE